MTRGIGYRAVILTNTDQLETTVSQLREFDAEREMNARATLAAR
jgi:hypothetical protein